MTLTSFSEDMESRGLARSSEVLDMRRVPAGASTGQALGISPSESILKIDRLRLANGEPMCLEHGALPGGSVPGIEQELDSSSSLFHVLRDRYAIRMARAEQIVRPTVISPGEAVLLSVPPLSPPLEIVRISYDDRSRRVEFARSLYRRDKYSIEVNLCR
jgi:GntR family transcriptional regulator